MILEVKNLSLAYLANQAYAYQGSATQLAGKEHCTPIFSEVSFTISPQQKIALIGRSGNGKSSLLSLLAGLEKPCAQSIFWEGVDLASMNSNQRAQLLNQIGFVFQFHNLLDHFTALENVMLPALIGGANTQEAEQRARELLKYIGLEHRIEHLPEQLSGGERQRVAIARAMINRPKIIFADEPTGNLDSATAAEVMKLLHQISADFGTALFLVTHDIEIARSLPICWRLENGSLITHG